MRFISLVFTLFIFPQVFAGGAFDHSHAQWTAWLSDHLSEGLVNYETASRNTGSIENYLSSLGSVEEKEFRVFTKDQQKAYWINLYNAATVKLILDHYPVSSIKEIGSLFSSPWKKKIGKYLGKNRTLDEIEHEILRKNFSDFRIHAAVNCASKSCPVLWPEAFVAGRLEEQMEEAMKTWINDKTKNEVDSERRRIKASKIFKWYGEDFESIPKIFQKYLSNSPKEGLDGFKIEFLDYSWSLNSIT